MFENPRLRVLAQVDPLPVFNFPYHTLEVAYQEHNLAGQVGRSYEKTSQLPPAFAAQAQNLGQVMAPPLRIFTLSFETMGYFKTADNQLDYETRPTLNMGLLERFYAIHSLAEEFLYPHPYMGNTRVRFQEPLSIPQGRTRGGGYLEPLQVKLVEVPTAASVKFNNFPLLAALLQRTGEQYQFPFMNHKVATDFRSESVSIQFGGNWAFRTRRAKPEQRRFRLEFETMRRQALSTGLPDVQTDVENNLAALESFYMYHRNSQTFIYDHPVYGPTPVRFDKPPTFPPGRPNGRGWSEKVNLALIEVM